MSQAVKDMRAIREAAAQWKVHFSSGEATLADHAVFEEWRNADPDHWVEYARVERAWEGVEGTAELRDLIPETKAFKNRQWASRPAAAAVVLAMGVLLAWIATIEKSSVVEDGRYATRVAETRTLRLQDGTRIELGARSSISIDYSAAQRRITLTGGEAFFDVAKDAQRPFWVSVGDTQIRAVGTQFDVRQGAEQVKVSVVEGVVEVTSGAAQERRRINAGQQIAAMRTGLAPTADNNSEWRSGRLVYVNEALREVVSDANRYHTSEIVLGSEDLGDLRVTAAFGTRQVEQMIRSLAVAHHLDVDRSTLGRIVLRK